MLKVGAGNISIALLQSEISKLESKQVHEEAVCINPHDCCIPGNGNISYNLASCCIPLPGDPITGIINTRNTTIRVHHSDCPNLKTIKPEKLCFPAWNCSYCSVKFSLFMNDKPDTFRPVLDLLAEILISRSSKPDVRDLQISKDGTAKAVVRIPVASRQDLDGIIELIESMPGVLKIKLTELTPIDKKNTR